MVPTAEQDLSTLIARFHFELMALGDYLWKMERAIDQLFEEEMDKWKELEAAKLIDRIVAEGWKLRFTFPSALRYSFVVLLYVQVESKLTELCNAIRDSRALPLGIADLKGSALERSRKYLFRLASFTQGQADWATLDELTKVRDCIVHTNGNVVLSRDQPYLRQLVVRSGFEQLLIARLTGQDGEWLIVKEPYTLLLTKRVTAFFHELGKELTQGTA